GITQRKNDDFSLSTGDFPTLGSEKDKSVHDVELQGSICRTIIDTKGSMVLY
ncbi:putative modifier OF SNC1 1, partial [Trifolium medium]|nr:putative modifier OF SNC1 1 [Trifolium medium]